MEGLPESESIVAELNAWCKKDDGNFVITSPATWVYNCIAFAMGSQDIWVAAGHPQCGFYAWWPPSVNRDGNPQSLIDAFKYLGFEICDDITTEEGYDKVVLYKKLGKDGTYTWTHAARVLNCNCLHSKLGACQDVYHRAGDIFEESDYGEEYAYMKRPVEKRNLTKELLPTQCEVRITGVRYMLTYDGGKLISMVKIE